MSNNIHNKLAELAEAVDQMEIMIFNKLVSWQSVASWPVGEKRNIGGSINEKIYQEHNIMFFETVIPPGVLFPHHWHDFKESNYIIKGVYTNGNGDHFTGDWVQYEKWVEHLAKNNHDIDLKIIVIFTKK